MVRSLRIYASWLPRAEDASEGQTPRTRKGRPSGPPLWKRESLRLLAAAGGRSAGTGALAHLVGHDADFLDAGPLGGVDDGDDLAVTQRPVTGDEHCLFLAGIEDV